MRLLTPLLWLAMLLAATHAASADAAAPKVASVRLYVFDCGTIHLDDLSRLSVTSQETGTNDISVACFLVVHPRGTLMWDTGAIADASWTPTESRGVHRILLPDGQHRDIELLEPLTLQLRKVGFSPGDIGYLALSHYHYDHTGNANIFTNATWLVRQEDRTPMFAAQAPGTTQPSSYAALKNAMTVIIDTPDYDVFGDGTVIIKFAPGHTPGHQVLALNLRKSGRIVLSGDLYHFPAERRLNRVPVIDADAAQTQTSRAAIEAFIAQNHAQLWIQHDIRGFSALKKAPQYYD